MRDGHHSGADGIVQEDALVCVSAGGVRDRDYEHLSTADAAVAQMYRTFLKSAKQVEDGGKPIGYGLSVADLRGSHAVLPAGSDWRSMLPGNLSHAYRRAAS